MTSEGRFKLDHARLTDVPALHTLINTFAARDVLLPRGMNELYENLRDYWVVRDGDKLVGCAALHLLWADLAEIRSVSVDEALQKEGLGSALVNACIEEAIKLAVPTVFVLTLRPNFFARLGFKQVELMSLPRKVFGECVRCPKFHRCDEIAMVQRLAPEEESR